MASSVLKNSGGMLNYRGQHTVNYTYLVQTDGVEVSLLNVLLTGQSVGPNPLPTYGSSPVGFAGIYAKDFQFRRTDENREYWYVNVSFQAPNPGETEEDMQQINPLLRGPVLDIRYRDTEEEVTEARPNVDLTGWDANEEPHRKAGELGAIVNGVGDTPFSKTLFNTVRYPIYVITQNIATLGPIVTQNDNFNWTTNSDTVNIGGTQIEPKKLKYLGARSNGQQEENGIKFYEMVTEIEQTRGTIYKLPNESLKYWDGGKGEHLPIQIEGKQALYPQPITPGGGNKVKGGVSNIDYEYLDAVPYAGFFP